MKLGRGSACPEHQAWFDEQVASFDAGIPPIPGVGEDVPGGFDTEGIWRGIEARLSETT